jgi:hypothetical protein
MGELNGNSFEIGRLFGELQTHMRVQTDILLDIKEGIDQLPSRLSSMTDTEVSAKPRLIPELTDLLRSLYPLIILTAATFGKVTWPTALPLIRDLIQAGGGP